uniref:Uncharacterized protein n=1 Tax=Bracon brevicornis TaxID=1563983 RepID=A0A6V7IMH5_9HYME
MGLGLTHPYRVQVISMFSSIFVPDEVHPSDLHFPMNAHDVENIYGKARVYLNGNKKLKDLAETLDIEKNELQVDYTAIVNLAQDIRDQANAVLRR